MQVRLGQRRQLARLLRSNIGDWSDEQLGKAYIPFTQAAAAFRMQKDQLGALGHSVARRPVAD